MEEDEHIKNDKFFQAEMLKLSVSPVHSMNQFSELKGSIIRAGIGYMDRLPSSHTKLKAASSGVTL